MRTIGIVGAAFVLGIGVGMAALAAFGPVPDGERVRDEPDLVEQSTQPAGRTPEVARKQRREARPPAKETTKDSGAPQPPPTAPELVRPQDADLRRALFAAYERASGGEAMSEDRIAPALARTAKVLNDALNHQARLDVQHEAFRQESGELGDPATMLLQAEATGTVYVTPTPNDSRSRHVEVAGSPLDCSTPLDGKQNRVLRLYRDTAAIPPGSIWVVEQIRFRAQLGVGGRSHGSVQLYGRTGRWLNLGRGITELSGILVGRELVRPTEEHNLRFSVTSARAEVLLEGRLVSPDQAQGLERKPFSLAPEDRVGFISGEPVTLQVLNPAGRGGWTQVGLDEPAPTKKKQGATPAAGDLWGRDPAEPGATQSVFRGHAGRIPPGFRVEIDRIDWRARFTPDELQQGRLVIQGPGKSINNPGGSLAPSGSASGFHPMRAGNEHSLGIRLFGPGIAEAVVHYRLVEE